MLLRLVVNREAVKNGRDLEYNVLLIRNGVLGFFLYLTKLPRFDHSTEGAQKSNSNIE